MVGILVVLFVDLLHIFIKFFLLENNCFMHKILGTQKQVTARNHNLIIKFAFLFNLL